MRKEILISPYITEKDLENLNLNLEFKGYEAGSNEWCLVYGNKDHTYILNRGDRMGGGYDSLYECEDDECIMLDPNNNITVMTKKEQIFWDTLQNMIYNYKEKDIAFDSDIFNAIMEAMDVYADYKNKKDEVN